MGWFSRFLRRLFKPNYCELTKEQYKYFKKIRNLKYVTNRGEDLNNDCSDKNGHFVQYMINQGVEETKAIVVQTGKGMHALTWIPGKGIYDATSSSSYAFSKLESKDESELVGKLADNYFYEFQYLTFPGDAMWNDGWEMEDKYIKKLS